MSWSVPRDFVRVAGPEAAVFLQGQLSQDIEGLEVGAGARSFLLQPQGKVDAYLRVTRAGAEEFVLDVDAGWGDAVVARLSRFTLRTKADIEVLDGWSCVAEVIGGALVEAVGPDLAGGDDDLAGYEELRIRAGEPRMGAEIDESTIPAALGVVDRAVSFTKGCYTGQELVARIDSRGGNTPTRLVGVRGLTAAGAPVVVGGKEVGRVTSAAGDVALALVRREIDLPTESSAGILDRLPLS